MRLPFFRASKPAVEPTRPARNRAGSAAAGSVKDALGLPGDASQQAARTAARRRLMGAAVLLAVGVIGFPILFETRPRPLPVDLPILLPEGAGRKVVSAASAPALPKPPPDAGLESGPAGQPAVVPTAGALPVAASAAPGQAAATASAAAARLAEAASPTPAASRPGAPVKPQAATVETAAESGRFVVQVGAYNDPERLRAARQKLEKLDLKSYTQDVETSSGKRTRVRVGPFPTRKEADAVAAKVKASGMQANILAL